MARAIDGFSLRWVDGIARRPGNPRRIEMARFGSATAPASCAQPDLDFLNRVIGLEPSDVVEVPRIMAWYQARRVRPWFEIWVEDDHRPLVDALVRAGAEPIGSVNVQATASMDATPLPVLDTSHDVSVHGVGHLDAVTWARTLLTGHSVDPAVVPDAAADLTHFCDEPGIDLFLARVDGHAAGAAVLTIDGGTAYLANAATVPELRGRGAQTALIASRLRRAREAGCDLVVSLTSADNDASRRNLERAGLRVVATKTVLRLGAEAGSAG